MPVPAFREDGYLPEGLHFASEDEVFARFGLSTSRRGFLMIRSQTEYEGAQRELRSLKEFLSRVESAPDHPNKELGIISIYKKMYHLWEELEEYYRACLSGELQCEPTEQRVEAAPSALSG